MKRRHFLCASAAALLPNLRAALAAPSLTEALNGAAQLIQAQIDSGTLESAVLDVRQGSFTDARAFGKAGSKDAIFLIASITKPMSAAGIMLLADRGALKLSDPVRKFIPEFSGGDRGDITIAHLLTHTSGLPDQLPENAALRKAHAPLEDFVQAALRTPLLFKPGTRYSYQSMGILLASEVAQRITQQPFRDFLASEVFSPLGMNRTALGLGRFHISETVRCQTENSATESGAGTPEAHDWNWNSPYWRNLGVPWGGAHASAADVSVFLRSFLNPSGAVLKKETARAMIRNQTQGLSTPRGLGFDLSPLSFGTSCSKKTFGHRGATGTVAWADPETGRTCVLLTSLPIRISGNLLLHPVSDLVSASG